MALFRRMGNKKIQGEQAQELFNKKLDEVRAFITDITHVAENGKRNGPDCLRPKRSLSCGASDELHRFNVTFAQPPAIGNRHYGQDAQLLCTEVEPNDAPLAKADAEYQ